MKHELTNQSMHIQADERVVLVVRKHWFVLLRDSIGVIIAGLIPVLLISALSTSPEGSALSAFLTGVWLLAVWMMLFTVWTNYYLDIWIVTDKRVINIDQIHLFKRDITTLRIERVQDITIEVHGLFATFLKFGNLEIQTAGPEMMSATVKGIPHPSYVRNTILEYVDMSTENKNRLTHDVNKRPTQE